MQRGSRSQRGVMYESGSARRRLRRQRWVAGVMWLVVAVLGVIFYSKLTYWWF